MNLRLKLRKWEIALLEWNLRTQEELGFPGASVSTTRKWTSTGLGPEAYAENQAYYNRKQYERNLKTMRNRLAYLKRHYFLERVKAGEEMLFKLTAKGKYELLRLQFVIQMQQQKNQKLGKTFYLIVFDIPEDRKKFRDVFRNLLKRNGFRMLQQSVWMTRYNPHPAIDALLEYLRLEKYFEIVEVDCRRCSSRLRRKL